MQDLVVAVADKSMQEAVRGLLDRPEALAIRRISFEIVVNRDTDAGSRLRSHLLLRSFVASHAYSLVMFDHEGCGRGTTPPEDLEAEIEGLMAANGWAGRTAAIVIAPELENWVWSSSPEVARVLGWKGRQPALDEWIAARFPMDPTGAKPLDPKGAVEAALKDAKVRKSSSLYGQLARSVGLQKCSDRAFLRLRQVLSRWFGGA